MDNKEELRPQAASRLVFWRDGIQALWELTAGQRKTVGLISILGVVSAIANGFVPYLSGRFFDALADTTRGGQSQTLVFTAFGLWLSAQLTANAVDWYGSHVSRRVFIETKLTLFHRSMTRLLRVPITLHKQERVSEILDTISRASWMAVNALRAVLTIAPMLLGVLVGIGIAFTIQSRLAWLLVLGAAIYSVILFRVTRNAGETFLVGQEEWSRAWGDAASSIQHIDTVKSSASENHEEQKFHDAFLKRALPSWMRMEHIWSYTNMYQRVIVLAVQSVILFTSIQLVMEHSLTLGQLIAFNGYALMFLGPFVAFGYEWQSIQNGLGTALKLKEKVSDQSMEIYEPDGAPSLENFQGEVRFENVSFRYPDGETNVLNDVSFSVSPGETIALVGESGVGKSTIIGLIQALYFPTEGSVRVGGYDTRKMNLTTLRSHIAVVPQEVALFNDTVGANISYGSFSASREDIEKAAHTAQAHEFIEKLPQKYDTVVGERGVKLSVGQKQRIAIARAVLRNPRILILDEPTSALDPKTETDLTQSLDLLMRERTTFIIAHRLSTVRKANRIIVIKNGAVVETGTHDELLARPDGEYRLLYEHHVGLHE